MTSLSTTHFDNIGHQPCSPGFKTSHQEHFDPLEYSSAAQRSSLNNSMTNFFPDKKYKKKGVQNEPSQQRNFIEPKNNGEGDSMSFTFYSTKNKSMRDELPEFGTGLPTIVKPKEYESSAASSLGFKLDENLLKKGVTLDKVFGGEFKRINVFDNRKVSNDAQDVFPDPEPDGETNREDKYKFESFEILETENEEDMEAGQALIDKTMPKGKDVSQVLNGPMPVKIIHRIQTKYKRSKSKSINKKKPSIPIDSESLVNGIIEVNKSLNKTAYVEDKMGSRSMSPKFRQEKINANKFRTNKLNNTRIGNMRNEHESLEESQTFSRKKNNLSSQTIFPTERKTKALVTSTTLGDVRESTESETSKLAILKTRRAIIKKSLASLNPSFLAEHENLGESQNELPTMPASKSSGLMNMVKLNTSLMSTQTQLTTNTGKAKETDIFKKRLVRENKVVAEKIKMHEREKLDRYSKMFRLNNQESN